MDEFESELMLMETLGFDREYREQLRKEYETGDRESVKRYVHAVICIYDDRKEYVDAV